MRNGVETHAVAGRLTSTRLFEGPAKDNGRDLFWE
jgi:hypothetical protein